jgi:hypothetical protein
MSSCTAASSLWLMVEDALRRASAWRKVLGECYAGEAGDGVSGDCVGKSPLLLLLLVWMLLDDA